MPPDDPSNPVGIGYPAAWLAATNYAQGPVSYDMPVNRAPDQRPASVIDALAYLRRRD